MLNWGRTQFQVCSLAEGRPIGGGKPSPFSRTPTSTLGPSPRWLTLAAFGVRVVLVGPASRIVRPTWGPSFPRTRMLNWAGPSSRCGVDRLRCRCGASRAGRLRERLVPLPWWQFRSTCGIDMRCGLLS